MSISNSNRSQSDSLFDLIRKFFKNKTIRHLYPERKQVWPASALLAGGLLLTLTVSLLLKSNVEQNAKKEFNFACTELRNKISARLHAHAQMLRSAATFFTYSDGITRNEWRNYYASQKIEQNLPGVQGFGYSVIVPPDQLARHEKEIQSEGFPQYSVRPAGKREIYAPVIYLEPFSGRNLRALGYDVFSEPVRRKAMETARDSDIAALTGKIMLVQETNANIQTGTIMYVPVYKKGMPLETIEERRRAIKGWVSNPNRMNDLIAGIIGSYEINGIKHIHLKIFDDSSYNPNTLLYDGSELPDDHSISPLLFSLKIPVPFNSRQWYLLLTQHKSEAAGLDYGKVWLAAAGGTSISVLSICSLSVAN